MSVPLRRAFSRSDPVLLALAAALTAGSALAAHGTGTVVPFVVSALAVAVLAALVGRAVDHLADRLGAGAAGVLQTALGNLPELFIALSRCGQGSQMSSRRPSSARSSPTCCWCSPVIRRRRPASRPSRVLPGRARMIMGLMLLAVAGMLVPSLAHFAHSPREGMRSASPA
ncbi:MAG: hypothetical protein ACM3ML_30660 [Micromonosporaceae bacterium]